VCLISLFISFELDGVFETKDDDVIAKHSEPGMMTSEVVVG